MKQTPFAWLASLYSKIVRGADWLLFKRKFVKEEEGEAGYARRMASWSYDGALFEYAMTIKTKFDPKSDLLVITQVQLGLLMEYLGQEYVDSMQARIVFMKEGFKSMPSIVSTGRLLNLGPFPKIEVV